MKTPTACPARRARPLKSHSWFLRAFWQQTVRRQYRRCRQPESKHFFSLPKSFGGLPAAHTFAGGFFRVRLRPLRRLFPHFAPFQRRLNFQNPSRFWFSRLQEHCRTRQRPLPQFLWQAAGDALTTHRRRFRQFSAQGSPCWCPQNPAKRPKRF